MVFNAIFNHISVTCGGQFFIGAGNRSTRKKPPTCRNHGQTFSHKVVLNTPRHEQGLGLWCLTGVPRGNHQPVANH